MKNKKMLITLLLIAIMVFGAGYVVGAVTAEPGSNEDPLITKSYLDTRIEEFNKETGYQKITVSKGRSLVCAAGTQVIMTSGTAKANAVLLDTTVGKKTSKSKKLAKNHTLLVTKDATAIKASGSSVVYVLGNYTLN